MRDKPYPNTILLTGATGALGSELLPRLLQRYPNSRLVAIVRGKSRQEAEARLAQAVDDPALFAAEGHRIEALPGDVGKPQFGLDDETAFRLAAVTGKLFHLAANVRFSATLSESRAGNVESTRMVLDFSLRCRNTNPNIFELHYISTAYVVGNRRGQLREDELNCGQGFWNAYEQSKLEAEELAVAARREMSVTIYRPSQVICLSADGKVRKLFGFLEFMKLACTGKVTIEILPAQPDVRTDMVPINYVCNAITYLSGEPDALGKTFLLAAGRERSLPLDEVIDIAYHIVREHVPDNDDIQKPRCLPPGTFDEHFQGGIHKSLGGLLGIYQTYLAYDRDFQVEETMIRLSRGGIVLPPMAEVIHASVQYVVQQHYNKSAITSA